MTLEEWDQHYWRIRLDLVRDGSCLAVAAQTADREATEQVGPRPLETP